MMSEWKFDLDTKNYIESSYKFTTYFCIHYFFEIFLAVDHSLSKTIILQIISKAMSLQSEKQLKHSKGKIEAYKAEKKANTTLKVI